VKLKGLQGTPKETVEAAEMAVCGALSGPPHCQSIKLLELDGQEPCGLYFADGFDSALVDVMDGGRRLESFTVSSQRDEAQKHAATLESLIDGDDDELGQALTPIKNFLGTIR
jgi:hypothetical protein